MFRSARVQDGDKPVSLILTVDGEGVVRLLGCDAEQLVVTPAQLGELLTGLVKAVCSLSDDEETIEVNLN